MKPQHVVTVGTITDNYMLACLLSHTHASSKGHYLLPLPSGSVAKCSNANMHWNQGHVLYLKRGIEKNSSRFASRAKQTGRKERLQDVRIHLHSKYKILHGKHQRILKEAKLPINVLKQCLGKRKGYPLRSGLFFLLFFFLAFAILFSWSLFLAAVKTSSCVWCHHMHEKEGHQRTYFFHSRQFP